MTKKKVIHPKFLPKDLKFSRILITVVALDYYHAPQWLWSVAITLHSITLVVTALQIAAEKWVNVVDIDNDPDI